MEPENQTMKQKMIMLAQSDLAPAAIEILKSCIRQTELLGNNEFDTVVNAVRFDTQQNIMLEFIKTLEDIRQGAMHELK